MELWHLYLWLLFASKENAKFFEFFIIKIPQYDIFIWQNANNAILLYTDSTNNAKLKNIYVIL